MPRPASLSAPGPSGARVYTLYPWYEPRRPLPVPKRPSWPPPMFKQGPYWVEPTQQGSLRCTPRRGTGAYQRMLRQQHQQARVQEVASGALFAFLVVFLFALALLLS